MQNVHEVSRVKDKILSTLRMRGPSLPVQIAKVINFSPLFASAFLSELKGENRIRISTMRVGSSALYYLPGQEEMLEKFSGYLNQREKEAFFLLKQKKILEDSEQTPVMRVALRAIKDFAFPVSAMVDGEKRLFWRHFAVSEDDVLERVSGKNEIKRNEKVQEVTSVEKRVEVKTPEVQRPIERRDSPRVEAQKALQEEERPLAERKKSKVSESEFAINVKDYLTSKDVEIMEVYEEKKKEFEARIRIDTLFGKQEFYLVAKDKKHVTDNDFAIAHQKAQGKNMLAAVMSTGEMNKKGKEHLEQWKNMVKFERLGF